MGNNTEVVIKVKADTGEASLSIGGLKKQIVEDLQKASAQAVEAFNKLRESGTASPQEVGRAFAGMERTIAANNALIVKASKDGFGAVGASAGTMAGSVNSNMKSMDESASLVGRGWAKLKGALMEITAAVGAAHFLVKWAQDSIAAEAAANKLRIQIENLGIAYKDVEGPVNAAIKATSEYAIVQEEDVAAALQQLIFITGDLQKSQENLNLVYDLAYLKGISVSESAMMIGKALTGNSEQLGRVMPEFRNLDEVLGSNRTRAQEAAYGMTVLAEKVAGAAAQMTDHERKVKQAHKVWYDITQYIGGVVVDVFDWLVRYFKEWNIGVLETLRSLAWVSDKLHLTTGMYGALGRAVDETKQELADLNNHTYGAAEETARLGKASRLAANDLGEITKAIEEEGKKAELSNEQILEITRKVTQAIRDQGITSTLTAAEKAAASKKINDLIKEEIKQAQARTKAEKEEAEKRVRLEKEAADKKKRIEKELLGAKIAYYNDQLRELKSTLSRAEERYREYHDEVLRLEGEIKKERGDAEDVLKDMRQKFFTEDQKNLALLKDAEGDLSAAKKAAARGDYAAAAGFFKKMQADYKALVDGVGGKDEKFAGSAKKIYDTAVKGYEEASKGLVDALTEQQKAGITAAMEQKKAYNDVAGQVDDVAKKVDELVKEKKALELEITVSGYDEAITKKAELETPTSSTHTIYVQEVTQKALGGPIGLPVMAASGRFFPGYGGGDKIPIMGEAGEFMNRKESVQYWGVGLFDALNRMDMAGVANALGARKYAEGGAIIAAQQGAPGSPGGMGNVTVDLKLGNTTFPLAASSDVAANLVKEIKKTHLLEGRYAQRYL